MRISSCLSGRQRRPASNSQANWPGRAASPRNGRARKRRNVRPMPKALAEASGRVDKSGAALAKGQTRLGEIKTALA